MGYDLSASGSCVAWPTSCPEGQTFEISSDGTMSCVDCQVENCLTCPLKSDMCEECTQGYIPTMNGQCIVEPSCAENQFLTHSPTGLICRDCIQEGCVKCHYGDFCEECGPDFTHLDSGVCVSNEVM